MTGDEEANNLGRVKKFPRSGPLVIKLAMEHEPNESQTPAIDEKGTLSAFELYQMALPHIIQSNLRVQKLISIEKKKQRVLFCCLFALMI